MFGINFSQQKKIVLVLCILIYVLFIGAAGSSCAEVLRQQRFEGRLIVLSKDKYLPYDRPKVSKMLDADISKISLREKEFYDVSDSLP